MNMKRNRKLEGISNEEKFIGFFFSAVLKFCKESPYNTHCLSCCPAHPCS